MLKDPIGAWLILIAPAVAIAMLAWSKLIRVVRERGRDYPEWGGHATVLAQFHQLTRAEVNTATRRRYRLILLALYGSVASIFLLMIVIWVAAAKG